MNLVMSDIFADLAFEGIMALSVALCLIAGHSMTQYVLNSVLKSVGFGPAEQPSVVGQLFDSRTDEKQMVQLLANEKLATNGRPSMLVENAIRHLTSSGGNARAVLIFHYTQQMKIPLTQATYSLVLRAAAQACEESEFLRILDTMDDGKITNSQVNSVIRTLRMRTKYTSAIAVVRKMKDAGGPCTIQTSVMQLLKSLSADRQTSEMLALFTELKEWIELSDAETAKILSFAIARGYTSDVEKLLAGEDESNTHYARILLQLSAKRQEDSSVLRIANAQLIHGNRPGTESENQAVMSAAVRGQNVAMAVKILDISPEWTPSLCLGVLTLFEADRELVWPMVQKMRSRLPVEGTYVPIARRIMDCYGKMGEFDEMVIIYEEIMRKQPHFLKTLEMNYYLKLMDQAGCHAPAIRVLEGMVGSLGPEPDAYSFTHTIRACGKARQLGDVFVVFNMAKEADLVNTVTYNVVIGACSGCRDHEAALSTIEEMQSAGHPLETSAFISLMNSFPLSETGNFSQAALDCYEFGCKQGIEMNNTVRSRALRTYIERQAWSDVAVCFANLTDPAIKRYGMNIYASALFEIGDTDWALSVIEQGEKDQIEFDSFSFLLTAKLYQRTEQWSKIIDAMKRAYAQNVSRSAGMYVIAFEACAQLGYAKDGLRLLDEMLKDGLYVTEKGYYYLMLVCLKKRMKPMVKQLHREMINAGVVPSERILELRWRASQRN